MTKEILVLYAILGFLVFFRYSTEDSKYPIIGIRVPKTRFQYIIYVIFIPTMIAYWLMVNILLFVIMLTMYPCVIFAEFIENTFYDLQDKKSVQRIKDSKFHKFIFGELKKEN